MDSVSLAARMSLACIFSVSGLLKFWYPETKAVALLKVAGIGTRRNRHLVLRILPFLELLLSIWLLTGLLALLSLVASFCILALFTAVIKRAMNNGYRKGCGCFGNFLSDSVLSHLGTNSLLLLAITFAIYSELKSSLRNQSVFDFDMGVALLFLMLIVILFGLHVLFREMENLLRLRRRT
jgi:hypothetical protein